MRTTNNRGCYNCGLYDIEGNKCLHPNATAGGRSGACGGYEDPDLRFWEPVPAEPPPPPPPDDTEPDTVDHPTHYTHANTLVYIAGPYRADTPWEVEQNIHHARALGQRVAELGFMPVIPHANTANFEGTNDDVFWLEGTMELLRRCDVVLMMPNWAESEGAKGELLEGLRIGLPVYYFVNDLKELS